MTYDLLTIEQLSDLLGVAPLTVHRMVKRGELPDGILLGKRKFWFRESIDKAMNNMRIRSEKNLRTK